MTSSQKNEKKNMKRSNGKGHRLGTFTSDENLYSRRKSLITQN